MKILVVVDMQNDFIDGALGTPEAQAIVPKVAQLMRDNANKDTVILFTKDTHETYYSNTLEGKNLPVEHCIRNTEGWNLNGKILDVYCQIIDYFRAVKIDNPMCDEFGMIEKPTFGSVEFQNILYELDEIEPIEEITLCGLCTGICVLSNAILAKASLPDVPVNVVADCCACVTPESHKTALDAMKLCQINII